jgi:hypothetical protein
MVRLLSLLIVLIVPNPFTPRTLPEAVSAGGETTAQPVPRPAAGDGSRRVHPHAPIGASGDSVAHERGSTPPRQPPLDER